LNFRRFVQRRARGDRFLALGILIAVFLAAMVMAGGPIYLRSLERIGMADVVARLGPFNKNVGATSDWIPLEAKAIAEANDIIDSAVHADLQPLITRSSTRIKSRAHFWGVENGDPKTATATKMTIMRGELASRAFFHEMEGLFDAVTYVEGRSPEANLRVDENGDQIVEVAFYLPRSKEIRNSGNVIDLNVGDIVTATSVSRSSGVVKGLVVGLFVENDRRDEFWLGSAGTILEPQSPAQFGGQDLPIILFTGEDTLAPGVGPSNSGLPVSYTRVSFLDPQKIARMKANVLVSAMDEFQEVIAREFPRGTALLGARATTKRMEEKMLFLRLPALLLAALGVAVVGYYLFLVSGLIARKRELETVMLRSRGLSTFQVLRVQIIEAIVTVGLPASIAPLLSYAAIGIAGRLPVFESITHGQNLPVELSLMAWVWSGGTAIIAFLIVLLPSLLVARSGVSNVDRARARPDQPPVFQRLYFDILIIILGGLFLWEITTRGVASTDREGEVVTDPTLLFAPAMLLVSVALIMLRVFPIMTRSTSWVASRFTSAPMTVGFWRLSRSPYWYAWPVLLIILGTGLGVMVGTLGSTLERSSSEQILYSTGTNLRVLPGGLHADVTTADIESINAIDGVNVATKAFRQNAKFGTTELGLQFKVLGVETGTFDQIAWFRDDFSEVSASELFAQLNVTSKPEPLILPAGTTTLSAWAKQDPFVLDHFFWLKVRGAEGRQITVTLGQIGDVWAKQTGDVPQHLVDPVEITSIQTFMQAGGDGGAVTTWSFDDLKASGPGFETTILDFDSPGLWTALPTSNGLDARYIDAPEPAGVGDPGSGIGQMTLDRGTIAGVRGAYRSSTGDPIPVIVSDNFTALTGVAPGQPAVVQISGGFIPILPVGNMKLFPTLDPGLQPFMVIDVDTLLDFVELRGMVFTSPNEVFVDIEQENHRGIAAQIGSVFPGASIHDREALLENSVIDPLTVAGWRAMGVVSLIIGGIALILGYVTYLVAHSNRTMHDSAYLRAMGLSKLGFMRSALIEHGIVAAIGVAVGVSAGLFASRVAVGAIAHSDTGGALVPPFILQTSWVPVLTILIISAVAGIFGVVSSFISFLRRPLHELTRSAE
jgi:hypothetical protein